MIRKLTYIVLFLMISIAQGKRVDIISPSKTVKQPIVIFSMCKRHIIYIYQHKGRTKVVSGQGLKPDSYKQIMKYVRKNPIRLDGKYITTIIPLPCPEPEYSSKTFT